MNEIYDLLFNSTWKSGINKGECTIKFIQRGTDGFDIIIIQDEMMLSRYQFKKYHFQICIPEADTLQNAYLIHIGKQNHFISILIDGRILVHLPKLNNLMLRKLEAEK